jgi:hypothetical protein
MDVTKVPSRIGWAGECGSTCFEVLSESLYKQLYPDCRRTAQAVDELCGVSYAVLGQIVGKGTVGNFPGQH